MRSPVDAGSRGASARGDAFFFAWTRRAARGAAARAGAAGGLVSLTVSLVSEPSTSASAAASTAAVLDKAGVEARVVYGPGVGHGFHGAVAEELKKTIVPWLVADDPRWH